MLFVAQRVAGGGVLEAYSGCNIAGVYLGDILTMVCMHQQDSTHSLALVLGSVENGSTSLKSTGVYAEEGQTANERVGGNLERQCGERSLVIGRTLILFVGIRIDTLDRRDINRSRHVINNCIQKHLNALVAVSGTTQYRNQLVVDGSLAECLLQILNRNLFALQVHHHQIFIGIADQLYHLVMVLLCLLNHICRDVLITDILAEVIIVNLCAHGHQVDDANEIALSANRQLNRNRNALQAILHHLNNVIEVCAHDVHLVDERHTRNHIIVSLVPYSLGLRLYATLCAEYTNGTVQYAQGTLYFYSEVNVARGVDDVDSVTLPVAGSSSGSDRDATFLLLYHPVHLGSAFMGLTDLVGTASVVQNTLCSGGLTSIDMSHDTNVSSIFQ